MMWGCKTPVLESCALCELMESGAGEVSSCIRVFIVSLLLWFQLGTMERYPDPWALQVAPEREGHGDDLSSTAGLLCQALQRG